MATEQNQIKKTTASLGKDVGNVTAHDMEQLGKRITEKGVMPKDILGLSDAMLEGLYAQAFRLYNTGKYKESSEIFRILMMIQVTESKFAMGFAACYHMMKEYKNAVNAYGVCSIMDPENPIPHFHASDCYIQMNDPISAMIELDMAVSKAKERHEFHTLKDRALLTIESLKKEIAEKGKTKK